MVPSRTRATERRARQAELEAIDPTLLREPIEFLFAEHYRQRAVLNHLDWLGREGPGEAQAKVARMILEFLRIDLAHHVADEEQDLFPLMRRHCVPDDRIDTVFQILVAEHKADEELMRGVLDGLAAIASGAGQKPGRGFRPAVRAFVETQRRHLAWENALILPLARKRLGADDLRKLGEGMAARRGLSVSPGDASEAPTARG